MAPYRLMGMFIISLLVLLLFSLGPVASKEDNSVHEISVDTPSTNGSTDVSRATPSDWCPAVCPFCPACPACPSAPPCPRHIPPGYKYYEGLGYYKMHYDIRTWAEAAWCCEAEGGYLAVINSQAEANLASSLMTKHKLTWNVHVGFHAAQRKDNYLSILGEKLSSTGYAVWAPGQPSGMGKENCGSLAINKGLDDVLCSVKYPSLCELYA